MILCPKEPLFVINCTFINITTWSMIMNVSRFCALPVLSGNTLFCNRTSQPVLCYFETVVKSGCRCLITSLMLKCFTMVAIYALRAWCWVRKQAGKLWMAVKLWSVLSLCLRALSKWSDCRFAAGLEGNVFVSAFYLVHIEIYIYVCNYVIQN